MPEYSFERHGAEGFVLMQDGAAHDPRIVLHDRQSANNLAQVLGNGENTGTIADELTALTPDDAGEVAVALWSCLTGEEEGDAPEDLHVHGEHAGEGLIFAHAHPFEEGVDHHHQIVITRDAMPGVPGAVTDLSAGIGPVDPAQVSEGGVGTPNPPAGSMASSADPTPAGPGQLPADGQGGA